jgi:formylglycine-generating enzyme required for sulfatase activity
MKVRQPSADRPSPHDSQQIPVPKNAPNGMFWIPGGEFSMGCKVPSNGFCTMATMNDAQPMHRVYVDGFWMDKTDATNASTENHIVINYGQPGKRHHR